MISIAYRKVLPWAGIHDQIQPGHSFDESKSRHERVFRTEQAFADLDGIERLPGIKSHYPSWACIRERQATWPNISREFRRSAEPVAPAKIAERRYRKEAVSNLTFCRDVRNAVQYGIPHDFGCDDSEIDRIKAFFLQLGCAGRE